MTQRYHVTARLTMDGEPEVELHTNDEGLVHLVQRLYPYFSIALTTPISKEAVDRALAEGT